jgi:nucleoside phosphorylase
MSGEGKIPAYFSHSYRAEDREINQFFWKLFWQSGFSFTVDPESETISFPHLELMMRWSACFVAVATHRPQQPFYRSSPFITYEYGLAVRAQKPRLVFIETGVPGHYFSEASVTSAFDRRRLEDRREHFLSQIEQLALQGRAYSSIGDRPRGPAGLILPPTRAYRGTREAIEKQLAAAGHEPRDINLTFDNSFQFALQLDACDFVVIDVGSRQLPSWIYPYLQGRFIPTIGLLYQSAGDSRREISSLSGADEALRAAGVKDELFIRWHSPEELKAQLERQVEKLFQPREPFQSEREGQDYFKNLGRRQVSIFVSNAGPDNTFASGLIRALNLENIKPFHYVYENPFELGKDWRNSLRARLQSTQLFVPLISQSYWESEWCDQEYKTAEDLRQRGVLTIIPYFLDDSNAPGPLITSQGGKLAHLPLQEQITRIVRDLDQYLTSAVTTEGAVDAKEPASQTSQGSRRSSRGKAAVDIAIITVLPEEHAAVHQHLERTSPVPATRGRPNLYAWEFGYIGSDQYQASYRVALGIAGRAGESSGLLAVMDAIQTFATDYVLLVGIAGGLGGLRKGDVVVSDYIYGYEYGKVDDGYHPRPDWTFSADLGLANAARALSTRKPTWSDGIALMPPEGKARPEVRIGPIASGNKVIDDISDPSFKPVLEHWPKLQAVEMEGLGVAQAIQQAREKGLVLNYSMVRGISDVPQNKQSRAATSPRGIVSAQTQERDQWKKYASEAAAVLTTQIIREAWRQPPRGV